MPFPCQTFSKVGRSTQRIKRTGYSNVNEHSGQRITSTLLCVMPNKKEIRRATLRITQPKPSWCLIQKHGPGAAQDFGTRTAGFVFDGARLCRRPAAAPSNSPLLPNSQAVAARQWNMLRLVEDDTAAFRDIAALSCACVLLQ